MKQLLGPEALEETLVDLARDVAGGLAGADRPALVGIRRRGVPLAERLAGHLAPHWGHRPEVGSLDIAFYRDDLSHVAQQPLVGITEIPFSLDDRSICLVDDVLFTGRTIRAALDALLEFGRPRCIRLAVIIDRGHRELPIQPDFIGLSVETKPRDDVRVMIRPVDEEEGAFITREGSRT